MDSLEQADIEHLVKSGYSPRPESLVAIGKQGNIIAFLESFAEACILFTSDNRKDRVENLREAFQIMKSIAQDRNIPDIYVFAKDEGFAEILKKHFNFQDCTGRPLVLHLR